MAKIENEKNESNDITSKELIELKKNLAKDVIDKLVTDDSNVMSTIIKWSIKNYLVDEKTLIDTIHDKVIVWWFWELIGLITPTLKKYREMFSKVNTKDELEDLRTTIFNEIWWTKSDSTTSTESENTKPKEPSKPTQENDWKAAKKETEEKVQDWLDKKSKTYTNAKSGLTYKCFDQVLDPASSLKDKSGTVASRWCLLASGATITSDFCPSVTLTDCFKNVNHRTADRAVEKMSNNKRTSKALLKWEHSNRTHKECETAQKEIEENLEKWYPAVIGARHKGIDGINSSIVSQHYRAIVDMRTHNGKKEFFVANTYKNRSWGWFSEDKIFKNMIHASIFTPNNT